MAKKIDIRRPNGQFGIGNNGGSGRPPKAVEESETREVSAIRRYVRRELIERGLVDRAIDMCEGAGKYSRLGPKTMHAIFTDLWDRAIGRPSPVNVAMIEMRGQGDEPVTTVKRIIGVSLDDI